MPRVLSIHAPYRCRDAGVCCSSGWPIAIERAQLSLAEAALRDGRLQPAVAGLAPFVPVTDAASDAPAVLATCDGACVFYRDHGAARCAVHRALGHGALPLACRQFPRVTVRDPRGASVTLSHYCPTAASLLDTPVPLAIVEQARGFPDDAEYDGLDATTSLPPRLRPDMLMDWDSWWRWERLAVEALASAATPREGLARLSTAVEHARDWRPSDGPLGARIDAAFAAPVVITTGATDDPAPLIDAVWRAIPAPLRPAGPARPGRPGRPAPEPRALVHFLAAHAFANWTAHLGTGLRAWLRSIDAAHALVAGGASVGEADLWLRHLADPFALADAWSVAEG